MESRQLIKKVIEFDNAPRIGYYFRNSDYPRDQVFHVYARRKDFDYGWREPSRFYEMHPELKHFRGFVRRDEYGNLWGKMPEDPSPQGEVLFGAIREWHQAENYCLPDLSETARYEHIPAEVRIAPDKFHIGQLPGFPFSVMRYLRKMENFLEDIIIEKEYVHSLNEKVVSQLLGIIENYKKAGMDAIHFCEDWGMQDRLMINPVLWREMFKPSFRILCDKAHDCGMFVFMHSCGCIYEILNDLIETGINAFQFDQPTLMGIDRISAMFRGKVTLMSPVDIQKILPAGDRNLIEKGARELVEKFFKNRGGGFIAWDYGDYKTLHIEEAWVKWARDEFIRTGGCEIENHV